MLGEKILKDLGLVSVIVANYNSERYLDGFLRALKSQTYKNFELIFVDDGSSDCSLRIVQKMDVPFRVLCIEKCHEGVAAARNSGISVAGGDFFIFVDVDDTLSRNHIETHVKELTDSGEDVVLIPILKNNKSSIYKNENISMDRLIQKIFIGEIPGWLHQFGSRRNIWEGISFIDGVDYAEDVFVLKQIASTYPDKVVSIRGHVKPTYVYEQHNGSVTNSPSKLTINKIFSLCRIVQEEYKRDSDVQIFLKRQMIYAYSLALRLGEPGLIKKVKKELLNGVLKEHLTRVETFRIRLGLFSIKSRMNLKKLKNK